MSNIQELEEKTLQLLKEFIEDFETGTMSINEVKEEFDLIMQIKKNISNIKEMDKVTEIIQNVESKIERSLNLKIFW